MTDKHDDIRSELTSLVEGGNQLLFIELLRTRDDLKAEAEGTLKRKTKKAESEAAEMRKALKRANSGLRFGTEYQKWYSRALPVVQQLLPDRHEEFADLHRVKGRREWLTTANYTVSDYVRGMTIRGQRDAHERVGLERFEDQIDILASAEGRLDSLLADIQGVLEADFFDDELDAARGLLKAKHIRSAGIVSGVVLERHLKRLIANHGVTLRKKPVLANLNQALKDAGVYDVPQWRQIQRLTDLRNLCGHDGERDPKKEEAMELIDGTEKIIATVF